MCESVFKFHAAEENNGYLKRISPRIEIISAVFRKNYVLKDNMKYKLIEKS